MYPKGLDLSKPHEPDPGGTQDGRQASKIVELTKNFLPGRYHARSAVFTGGATLQTGGGGVCEASPPYPILHLWREEHPVIWHL